MPDRWVQDRRNDAWTKQAKAGGYRARSAFKFSVPRMIAFRRSSGKLLN